MTPCASKRKRSTSAPRSTPWTTMAKTRRTKAMAKRHLRLKAWSQGVHADHDRVDEQQGQLCEPSAHAHCSIDAFRLCWAQSDRYPERGALDGISYLQDATVSKADAEFAPPYSLQSVLGLTLCLRVCSLRKLLWYNFGRNHALKAKVLWRDRIGVDDAQFEKLPGYARVGSRYQHWTNLASYAVPKVRGARQRDSSDL